MFRSGFEIIERVSTALGKKGFHDVGVTGLSTGDAAVFFDESHYQGPNEEIIDRIANLPDKERADVQELHDALSDMKKPPDDPAYVKVWSALRDKGFCRGVRVLENEDSLVVVVGEDRYEGSVEQLISRINRCTRSPDRRDNGMLNVALQDLAIGRQR